MDSAKSINAVFALLGEKAVTLDELELISPVNRHETVKIMSRLVSRGAVDRLENGVYRLNGKGKSLKSSGKKEIFHAGAQGLFNRNKHPSTTLRARVWRLMQLTPKFTVNEIKSLVSDGNEKAAENNIQKYVRALVKSGYIREMPKRLRGSVPTSNGYKQYLLIKNTGPKAPVLRNDKRQIFDQNTRETFQW